MAISFCLYLYNCRNRCRKTSRLLFRSQKVKRALHSHHLEKGNFLSWTPVHSFYLTAWICRNQTAFPPRLQFEPGKFLSSSKALSFSFVYDKQVQYKRRNTLSSNKHRYRISVTLLYIFFHFHVFYFKYIIHAATSHITTKRLLNF